MTNIDHEGKKKIQCWIPQDMWDKISLIYSNQTVAVTKAFELLLGDIPEYPRESQNIPELRAQIEGLQMLLQEKDERISDLKREAETLGIFAHYFKSLEHRRLEASTEDREIRTQGREEKPARKPREASKREERKIVQEPEEKPASSPGEASTEKDKGALLKKTCKNCGAEFEASNPRQETCSQKCRSAYSRKNRK